MLSWCDRLMGLSSGLRILKRPDFLLGRRGGGLPKLHRFLHALMSTSLLSCLLFGWGGNNVFTLTLL